VLLQIASSHFEPHRVGRIFQALFVLSASAAVLRLSPLALAWVMIGVAGGALLFSGIVMFAAGTQFWTLGQTSELQNMLTYGGTAALSYPISIYEAWFRRVLTYGVPLAFVNYFPALAALGRTGRAGVAPFVPWLSPIVCSAVALAGALFFRRGLGRYESTGS
jgi:ABC-2 type transport system permease protein